MRRRPARYSDRKRTPECDAVLVFSCLEYTGRDHGLIIALKRVEQAFIRRVIYGFGTAFGQCMEILACLFSAVLGADRVSDLFTVHVSDAVDERFNVFGQLVVPSVLIPPLSGFSTKFREDTVRLTLPEFLQDLRHPLVFFFGRSSFYTELLGLGLLAHLLGLFYRHRLLLFHVCVLRRRLSALYHIKRHDQLVAALDRRQVIIGPGFVPGHPGTADCGLKDGRTFLKGALELLCEVKFDIGEIRIRADHRQEEAVDPLLQHLQDWSETLRIERPGVVFGARIGLRICVPYERRIDTVCGCTGFS